MNTPPSNGINNTSLTIDPRLDSSARIALAIRLLQTKPQSLSISEFLGLLRSHTVLGGRSLNNASERRHIEACEFWRKRSEVDAGKALELQAKVNELTGKISALAKTSKVDCQPQESPKSLGGGPAKKKGKVANKKNDLGSAAKRAENQTRTYKKQKKQEVSEFDQKETPDEVFAPFSGSAISNLVLSLRLLQFTKEPCLVPRSIIQISQALSVVVQDFINGKLSKVVSPVHFTRGVAATQTQESKEIASLSQVIEKTCTKAILILKPLSDSPWEGGKVTETRNKEFLADGIGGVIKILTGLFSLIHKNTRDLLSEKLYPQASSAKSTVKDIRLELTMVIIRLLKTLNLDICYQSNILEGTFHCLLKIINSILSRSFIDTLSKGTEDAVLLEKLAVEETSWYFLRIFESVLRVLSYPLKAEEKKLEKKSIERLNHLLINDIFGGQMEDRGEIEGNRKRKRGNEEGFWESLEANSSNKDFLIIESPFSRALWELLGLDVLEI